MGVYSDEHREPAVLECVKTIQRTAESLGVSEKEVLGEVIDCIAGHDLINYKWGRLLNKITSGETK